MHEIIKRASIISGTFLLVFFVSAILLYLIDFVPEAPAPEVQPTSTAAAPIAEVPEVPIHIVIPAVGVNTAIMNPTSTDVRVLDSALLSGAVHYPGSADLGELGTVYLFGHQSYLPVVHNQAFKAFNDLQKLEEGDLITVSSATAVYTYAVRTVTLTNANGIVPLESDAHTLILSTCNSFSANHEERYLVVADLITRTALPSTTN